MRYASGQTGFLALPLYESVDAWHILVVAIPHKHRIIEDDGIVGSLGEYSQKEPMVIIFVNNSPYSLILGKDASVIGYSLHKALGTLHAHNFWLIEDPALSIHRIEPKTVHEELRVVRKNTAAQPAQIEQPCQVIAG